MAASDSVRHPYKDNHDALSRNVDWIADIHRIMGHPDCGDPSDIYVIFHNTNGRFGPDCIQNRFAF